MQLSTILTTKNATKKQPQNCEGMLDKIFPLPTTQLHDELLKLMFEGENDFILGYN